jgi:hypothetical protein
MSSERLGLARARCGRLEGRRGTGGRRFIARAAAPPGTPAQRRTPVPLDVTMMGRSNVLPCGSVAVVGHALLLARGKGA